MCHWANARADKHFLEFDNGGAWTFADTLIRVQQAPAVLEAAAIPVPSSESEDEVLLVVTASVGQLIEPRALLRFLVPRMAHFMLPRYIRVVVEMPKTPTAKIEKHRLRAEGVTADTWDREAHGATVRRGDIAGLQSD